VNQNEEKCKEEFRFQNALHLLGRKISVISLLKEVVKIDMDNGMTPVFYFTLYSENFKPSGQAKIKALALCGIGCSKILFKISNRV
jgi:hypothetical protein